MKNYNYLGLLGLCLLLAQSGNLSAGSGTRGDRLINDAIRGWRIFDGGHQTLLYQAAVPGSFMILSYESDPRRYSSEYPSKVLRAAKKIAQEIQGEDSRVYRTLERMLSYK